MVDGDTVFEPRHGPPSSSGRSPTRRSARSPATPRSATGGGLLGRWQHIEYVIGFNLDRRMFDVLQCMPTVPGAVGAFRREALTEVGGVSDDTLAEDTDLTMAIVPGRLAGRLRGAALGLDRGAGDPAASCGGSATAGATARMQAMWKHRARAGRARARRPVRPARACPTSRCSRCCCRCSRRSMDVFALYGLLFLDPCETARGCGWLLACRCSRAPYAFRLDREPLGRCGRCRCSRSSTAS